jgi:hypothetical protein
MELVLHGIAAKAAQPLEIVALPGKGVFVLYDLT